MPLSCALDELGSSHDMPLPSLDTAPVADENDNDDDDFGDFEAPEVPATTVLEETLLLQMRLVASIRMQPQLRCRCRLLLMS